MVALNRNLRGKTGDMARLMDLFRSRATFFAAVACLVIGLGAGELFGQAASVPPSAAEAPTVIVQGRSLGFEWILTIAMCGAALFVVCRSSRRN